VIGIEVPQSSLVIDLRKRAINIRDKAMGLMIPDSGNVGSKGVILGVLRSYLSSNRFDSPKNCFI